MKKIKSRIFNLSKKKKIIYFAISPILLITSYLYFVYIAYHRINKAHPGSSSEVVLGFALEIVAGNIFAILVTILIIVLILKVIYRFFIRLPLNSRFIFIIITLFMILSCMIVFPTPACTNCN